ncbi:CBS domain-containing mitochondrial [Chlorella sorokiniana]|jgi:CBS domain-containing protein|uniref:CBS domain-containing mitochondrial n=1 Tax=Chlorella sorokiniana TaxID=3076 RepID=A0A2P6U2R2_CHLSO|nr:CBS domain-containing mitochondrial [Chlorella sorokiniana]|eukprot:PRW60603.1 CBS domain-containing mitochondrial [Chlorella sorokiniana]
MALRQALSTLARRGLAASSTLRLAPLAAASSAVTSGWAPGSAASLLSRGLSAEAVAEREKKLPETSGWGSTLVGHLLKAKAEDSGAWLWCAADEMVIDAVRKMTHANVGSLLVFDPSKLHLVKCGVDQVCNASKDAVVGIITERDYLNKVVVKGKQSSSTKVSDIMTPSEVLLTVTPQHSVLDVMELMVDKNVRHLPVIDEGNMVGMISIKDVVHVMLKEHREEVTRMEEYIQGTY